MRRDQFFLTILLVYRTLMRMKTGFSRGKFCNLFRVNFIALFKLERAVKSYELQHFYNFIDFFHNKFPNELACIM